MYQTLSSQYDIVKLWYNWVNIDFALFSVRHKRIFNQINFIYEKKKNKFQHCWLSPSFLPFLAHAVTSKSPLSMLLQPKLFHCGINEIWKLFFSRPWPKDGLCKFANRALIISFEEFSNNSFH